LSDRIFLQDEFATSSTLTINIDEFERGNYLMEIVSDEYRNASKLILE
jgi:hypothetical protein